MKRLGVMAVVIALGGMAANAALITDPPLALKMALEYDAAGNAVIRNLTGALVEIDGYEIWSASGRLSSAGWYSIEDAVAMEDPGLVPALGTGAYTFGELTAQTGLLAEGSLTSDLNFQAGASWGIGAPILAGTSVSDLTFWYSLKPNTKPGGQGTPGDKYLGVIIPEPATMGLLVIGGLGLIARRRR